MNRPPCNKNNDSLPDELTFVPDKYSSSKISKDLDLVPLITMVTIIGKQNYTRFSDSFPLAV